MTPTSRPWSDWPCCGTSRSPATAPAPTTSSPRRCSASQGPRAGRWPSAAPKHAVPAAPGGRLPPRWAGNGPWLRATLIVNAKARTVPVLDSYLRRRLGAGDGGLPVRAQRHARGAVLGQLDAEDLVELDDVVVEAEHAARHVEPPDAGGALAD